MESYKLTFKDGGSKTSPDGQKPENDGQNTITTIKQKGKTNRADITDQNNLTSDQPNNDDPNDSNIGCKNKQDGNQISQLPIENGCTEYVQLWTSEGKTDPIPVILKPFLDRYEGEKPCYTKEEN